MALGGSAFADSTASDVTGKCCVQQPSMSLGSWKLRLYQACPRHLLQAVALLVM